MHTDRRNLIKGILVSGVAAAAGEHVSSAQPLASTPPSTNGDRILPDSTKPVARTRAGKVRGYVRNGIATFKGIPYADTTAGTNRFAPPQPPKPWNEPRSSMQYGPVSPQPPREGWSHDEQAWLFSWDDGHAGEDCLCLNVWTPGLDTKKRPVMVWLHGGGFVAGSSQELLSYDGEHLAHRGDVVIVSVNHRLGVLGFLNVSKLPGGEGLSANQGMLDIVAALQWVRDNIGEFGGDPSNVTIFGQSGGGGKVNAIMTMPAAAGLFHRAIVESGSIMTAASEDASHSWTQKVLSQLGMPNASVEDLRKLPYDKLVQASDEVMGAAIRPLLTGGGPLRFDKLSDFMWSPVIDGKTLPHAPTGAEPGDPGYKVPLLVGNTLNEFVSGTDHPEWLSMTFADVEKRIAPAYGSRSKAVLEAFRRSDPHATPLSIWSQIFTVPVRAATLQQAALKNKTGAPAFVYLFAWQSPVLDGRPMAFHCSELSFVFDNTDRCENMTGGGPDARALAERMSSAWINFARAGDPNAPGLPHWAPATSTGIPTMIFDRECSVRIDPDKEEQEVAALR